MSFCFWSTAAESFIFKSAALNVMDEVDENFVWNKKYVLWNVYLPNALHSVCLSKLSCTEEVMYGANSPNGFLTPAVA